MSEFAVDLELLTELIDRMAACERRFEAARDEVDRRARRLHVEWRGAAAAEHAEAHQRWTTAAAQMHEALGVLRSIASTAHENYASAVRANASMWSI